eukprot:TRINITY_DN1125_c0_g1_i1.p1 TRINITY_DN1125_c0_g1~~TRINITY_DN1125_c0_g1_i1.p1  ORF type:complete len:261 (-),score=60.93 TRINITY_DN1125_c0_g1_i1:232-1014(-)
MCLKAPATTSTATASSSAQAPVKTVHPLLVKRSLASGNYVLIDVREAKERVESEKKLAAMKDEKEKKVDMDYLTNSVNYPLGELIVLAVAGKLNDLKSKKVVCMCPKGYRSAIAVRELTTFGFDAYNLVGGISAWENPIQSDFDFATLLGRTDADSVSMALTFSLNAQNEGKNTILILTSEGIRLMVPGAFKDLKNPSPFKPCQDLMDSFLKAGGIIFCCKSCVLARGLSFDKLEKHAHECGAYDVVRWLSNATGTCQYA